MVKIKMKRSLSPKKVKVMIPIKKKNNVENKVKSKKFVYYPDFDDKDFYEKIYTKKEFYKNRINKSSKTTEEICNARLYTLNPQQEFLKNYISIDTPYNGILIYHGTGVGKTCSAVQISEGFINIMRRLHTDDKRKITVLVSKRILPGFVNEIYDIKKEAKKIKPDDIVQCTGNTYSLDFEQFSGLTTYQKMKETRRKVYNNYKFYGYEQFTNELMNQIGWDGKINTLTDIQKKAIKSKFTNRILIIDEIHNIKSDVGNVELRKVPPILQAIIRYGENIRLVLMSATPMHDNAGELIYILNLLLENDGRPPIKKNEIFDNNDNLVPGGAERLKEISKGYISFLRGENPIIFPLKIEPADATVPDIKFDIYGKKIPPDERFKRLKLLLCNMSQYQYEQYMKKLKSREKDEENNENENESNLNNNEIKKKKEEQFASSTLRQLANIILPNKNNDYCLYGHKESNRGKDEAYQLSDNGQGAFIMDLGYGRVTSSDNKKGRRKTYQFRYQSHLIFDQRTKEEAPFLDEKYLDKYSVKFFNALNNIKDGKGICYVYSEYLWGGVIPFAIMLEQNGFERYPWSGERPLLDYHKKRNPICAICGKGALASVHENERLDSYHEFRRARYILVTGDANVSLMETGNLMSIINNENNKNGEEVKVIIGSRTTGEGLDFKRIRQVHVLEPWFNLSRIDQIVGRASRNCSHADLPKMDRNVEVFLYAVEPPNRASKKDKETETIDTRIYRIAEIKDRKIKEVEYVLKQAAVDCALNKQGNVFDFGGKSVEMISSLGRRVRLSLGDVNGSRECDYRDCYYKCVWEPESKKVYKINIDTYNERFARSDIEKAKKIIKNMYKYGIVYELDDLVKMVQKYMKLETRFIYIAISEMINNMDEPLYDMYNRRGYLIYRGNYYIYQPLEFNYVKAPLRYRMIPFTEKTRSYSFEDDIMENEEFEVVSEKEGDSFDEIYEKAEKISGEIKSDYKDKMFIIMAMIVDKLNDKSKANLIKKVLMDYFETKGKMSHPYQYFLFRYFEPLYLYKSRDELGRGYVDDDKIIGFYYVFPEREEVNVRKSVKIYCWDKETRLISECDAKRRDTIKLNMKVRLAKEGKNSFKNPNSIYGYMSMKDGPYFFKIFDTTMETGAITKEMKKSKRSEIKGKECSYHSMDDLVEKAKKLGIKLNDKQKRNICVLLEYYLREYDERKKDGRRWFKDCVQEIRERGGFVKKS